MGFVFELAVVLIIIGLLYLGFNSMKPNESCGFVVTKAIGNATDASPRFEWKCGVV